MLNRTIQYLENEGMDICVFDKVTQNPLTTTVEDGVKQFHQGQCDLVIGLGGGSIMDCAKAIAFFAKNEGDMTDYIFARKISDQAYPLILIPTTCGTGSEGNGFAVLTNPENGDKKSLRCNAIIAKASIIDSELMETMPKSILASVGFVFIRHAMAAVLSRNGPPVTDQMAIRSVELIGTKVGKD